MAAAKKGDKVKVHYTGTLDNGEVFDSSEGRDPLEFEVGSEGIIKGFSIGVEGLEPGQEREVKVSPEDAYGERRDDLVQEVPKDMMPKEMELKKGMTLFLKHPSGQAMPVTLVEVGEQKVKVDLNHPLAGKELNFKIRLEEIA